MKNKAEIFFFFPCLNVGGAEKVHIDIINAVSDLKPYVVLTHRSKNKCYSNINNNVRLIDISSFNVFKIVYYLMVFLIILFVNYKKGSIVFGSNTPVFYRMLPFLKKDIFRIDLTHAVVDIDRGLKLSLISRIDKRIVISNKTYKDFFYYYKKNNLGDGLFERVAVIENSVEIPQFFEKETRKAIKVVYIGRGSAEKRVHLAGMVASKCSKLGIDVLFDFVGDVTHSVRPEDRASCSFLGEIVDTGRLNEIYKNADLLILTSSREGFPLVVMESMANGVIPICVDVGAISEHVLNGHTGFLVENHSDEKQIVEDMSSRIKWLAENRRIVSEMAVAVYQYASSKFNRKNFIDQYRALLIDREKK